MADKQELILVDGSSYLFRAFHALPPLVSSRGQPTGAVKGVISMVRALVREHKDSPIAIVFDAKGKTFRSDIFKDYKANRPPMPDELRSQIKPIHEIIQAMGLPMLIIDGVEADDVIGTLARQAEERGMRVLISTGDKDLAQLVTENIRLINTMSKELLDVEGVHKKFGVGPDCIVDYLALIGDKVDNIPGIQGVGPKTAVKWLTEHGSLDGVLENAEDIGGKIGERLRDNVEQARLSYTLATIKEDCEIGVALEELVAGEQDRQTLYDLFTLLEFKTWVKELEDEGIAGTSQAFQDAAPDEEALDENITVRPEDIEYRLIETMEELEELLLAVRESRRVAISLEAEEGPVMNARVLGLALSIEAGKASYLPLPLPREENDSDGQGQEDKGDDGENGDAAAAASEIRRQRLDLLRPVLEDAEITKLGYDLKRERHLLANLDIELLPLKSDVLLASYVLNSVAVKQQLPEIARFYLDLEMTNPETVMGKGRKKRKLIELGHEELLPLAAEKADFIFRLAVHLEQTLAKEAGLFDLYKYYEVALIEALQTVERNGIRLDADILATQSKEIEKQIDALEKQVFSLAGEEFNLSSPKQLQSILYEKLELPVLKKTKTGQPSTAEPVLHELAEQYELPQLILEYRSLTKLKTTYTDKLPLQVNERTGRIHSTFQQAVAATGRLSSTEPNLQNIPIRTEAGRRVRTAFVPEPGNKLLAADYSQVELRIMAHLSQDKGLLKAFSSDEDVHRATASEVFGVALDAVSDEQRRSAKAINFGLIYGMSAFGLAAQIGVDRGEAQNYVDRYFEKYPGVLKFMDQTRALADEKGYVQTIFGRRLYLPDIHAGNGMLRRAAQRTAINAPMQGSAADIIKRAMIDIHQWLCASDLDARMVLQVHDELVFEVAEADAQLLAEGVRFRMISAAALDVPLVVDVGIGDNWDQAH